VFVKNLENVQGDERDCVILSVAYANDKDGKFAMRFGPLNQEGGHRRLNVAITRARKRMLVVTSVRSDEFRVTAASPRGVQNLHAFIRFAEEGPASLGPTAGQQLGGFDSPFEESVARALAERGLSVVPQVGCSRFRIDLGVTHPDDPSRYVLGIECDGATYHRSAVARDRDRLRQEVLEGLGWTIVRVWSTDWVRNPGRQIDRIVAVYREKVGPFEENVRV
jgi:very-short-patch-repair endonuclease